ncbi:hypothetical protein FAZ19_18405 [Sphingobacterium alkalisoli]|uniref:Uncharacterized protein n=1 Tax=Sphingobacterium alkalisoli TaxID=1874115 RepID=A0A4U0GWN3_9SPHI|nr:hypothetical protein [Sphingobacterium alkalisoli]TJY63550.1 hypothetical protein FAZ19_18405 [Sphingobacterium alkalisoli]GGH26771.1 hypothetical protein GCM10011418_36260 [Sphingobacterium alkalisoli]
MFRFLKNKSKFVQDWEKQTFKKIFEDLGVEFDTFSKQMQYTQKIKMDETSKSCFYSLIYPVSFYKDFENRLDTNFKIENIKVHNLKNKESMFIILYFASNIFLAYSTSLARSKFEFDYKNIDLSGIKIAMWGDTEGLQVLELLTKEEEHYVNSGDIYISKIEGKEYFHLKELEDGDFVGIDKDSNVFVITHDPLEVKPFERGKLLDVLKSSSDGHDA